jgi:phage-related protein (TIGR01555 family)
MIECKVFRLLLHGGTWYPYRMACAHSAIASLSPGGACVVCRARAAERMDGWQNALTGIGSVLTDKRLSTEFRLDLVTSEVAEQLWRGDDLAARIVETWPSEMLREGYEITVSSEKKTEAGDTVERALERGDSLGWIERKRKRVDAAEKGMKLATQVRTKLEELDANTALHTVLSYRRAYGGGAILMGANDGSTDLMLPLDEERVSEVNFLTTLEPRELIPLYYYADPRAPKFGSVAIWHLQTVAPGAPQPSAGTQVGAFGVTNCYVHESRLIIFQGAKVTRRVSMEVHSGWGDSIFSRVNRVLSDFNVSYASAGILVHDFAQAVFKIKGLAEAMGMDKDDLLKIRMRAVELSRSTARAILIDSEEEFKREQTPVTGLPELLETFMARLAAAADMPLTLLMGQSPGGLNATGDSDIRFFYDRVASAQEKDLRPALERLIRIIFRSLGGIPEQWDLTFHPLWQPTDKESAEARKIQAETDDIYFAMGALSAGEIAKNRFGGEKYSFETKIDFDARERLEVAAPPPVEKDGEDPNDTPDPFEGGPGGGFGGPPAAGGGKPPFGGGGFPSGKNPPGAGGGKPPFGASGKKPAPAER